MNNLIQDIRNGDRKIFRAFFEQHYKALVNYANAYLFDIDASEDIVQEVFIALWEKSEVLNIEHSLIAYVRSMVRNSCLNYLKSIKITDDFKLLEMNASFITEYTFDVEEEDKKILYRQIMKSIDALPERMRTVVTLKFMHNYTYKDIAKELNISVNTVKTQLKRAKVRIIELLTSLLILLNGF